MSTRLQKQLAQGNRHQQMGNATEVVFTLPYNAVTAIAIKYVLGGFSKSLLNKSSMYYYYEVIFVHHLMQT